MSINANPKGMSRSLQFLDQEQQQKRSGELAAPIVAFCIKSKGYEWHLKQAIKNRCQFKETVTQDSRLLQVGRVVYICFNYVDKK